MPLYEFYCADCRGKFEVLTSYEASRGQMLCANCHGANVRKLLSVVARPARSGAVSDFGAYDDAGDDCACGSGGCGCNN